MRIDGDLSEPATNGIGELGGSRYDSMWIYKIVDVENVTILMFKNNINPRVNIF